MNNLLELEKLASQYFSGKISLDKESELLEFMNQSPSNFTLFRKWEKVWIESAQNKDDIHSEWESFVATKKLFTKPTQKHIKFGFVKQLAKIAAILLITVVSTLYIQSLIGNTNDKRFVSVEAPYGEKSKITLSDGSVVWLNSGSTLSYAEQNPKNKQIVTLSGEGYFEVAKNKNRKFIVRTKFYDVEVVGTKFNVTAYNDDRYITTTLLEGKVNLVENNTKTELLPGQYISYDTLTGTLQSPEIAMQSPNAWINNVFIYDDITLQELVTKLSRQYNVNIILQSDAIANKKINIALRNDESISDVMKAIEKILNVNIRNTGINYQIDLK